MQAKDVMTTRVVTVGPETTVREIAGVLHEKGISAVPVVDDDGALLGIVSEGDLIHRQEIGTERRKGSWWLRLLGGTESLAIDYTKSHGMHARDVMTRNVITVSESASLVNVAEILETKRVKRVPVLRDGALVGIVSRANLVQALASRPERAPERTSGDDETIRNKVIGILDSEPWGGTWTTVIVSNGIVDLYGTVVTEAERTASRVAAENVPGVAAVNDRRGAEKYASSGI
jgi:CBS domain-containing protein